MIKWKKFSYFFFVLIVLFILLKSNCFAETAKGLTMINLSNQIIEKQNTLRVQDDKLTWETEGGLGIYDLRNKQKKFLKLRGNSLMISGNFIAYKSSESKYSQKLKLYDFTKKERKNIFISPQACCFSSFAFKNDYLVWYEGENYLGFYNTLTGKKSIFPLQIDDIKKKKISYLSLSTTWVAFQCSDSRLDKIYVYNLLSREKIEFKGIMPKIDGDYLVYLQENQANKKSKDIFIYDLSKKKEIKLSHTGGVTGLAISDNMVAWQEGGEEKTISSLVVLNIENAEGIRIPMDEKVNNLWGEIAVYKNKLAFVNNLQENKCAYLNLIDLTDNIK